GGGFTERYLRRFKGVKRYMEEMVEEGKEKGYVRRVVKGRGYIGDMRRGNFNVKRFGERRGMNTAMEGSGGDMMKKAVIDMGGKLKEEKVEGNVLLEVEDEVMFEGGEEEMGIVEKIVAEVMENAVEVDVPVKVDFA
ncbi:DNA polymerase, partial [Bacillus altitudinis]|uniref:DNA polymerase n=1 Tax=Bacillus altitudinis TaxID=293387 RepID=UPI00235580CB